jgi:hypothetical protein
LHAQVHAEDATIHHAEAHGAHHEDEEEDVV